MSKYFPDAKSSVVFEKDWATISQIQFMARKRTKYALRQGETRIFQTDVNFHKVDCVFIYKIIELKIFFHIFSQI